MVQIACLVWCPVCHGLDGLHRFHPERRIDTARKNACHVNAPWSDFHPERVIQYPQGALAGCVGPKVRQSHQSADGVDVNDSAARGAGKRQERLGDGQGAEQVNVHLVTEKVQGQELQRAGQWDAGAVDETGEDLTVFHRLRHAGCESLDGCVVPHIQAHGCDPLRLLRNKGAGILVVSNAAENA